MRAEVGGGRLRRLPAIRSYAMSVACCAKALSALKEKNRTSEARLVQFKAHATIGRWWTYRQSEARMRRKNSQRCSVLPKCR